jgi:hypothetical protein
VSVHKVTLAEKSPTREAGATKRVGLSCLPGRITIAGTSLADCNPVFSRHDLCSSGLVLAAFGLCPVVEVGGTLPHRRASAIWLGRQRSERFHQIATYEVQKAAG